MSVLIDAVCITHPSCASSTNAKSERKLSKSLSRFRSTIFTPKPQLVAPSPREQAALSSPAQPSPSPLSKSQKDYIWITVEPPSPCTPVVHPSSSLSMSVPQPSGYNANQPRSPYSSSPLSKSFSSSSSSISSNSSSSAFNLDLATIIAGLEKYSSSSSPSQSSSSQSQQQMSRRPPSLQQIERWAIPRLSRRASVSKIQIASQKRQERQSLEQQAF